MKSRLGLVLLVMAGLVGCRFPAIAPQTPVADAPATIGQALPAPALQGRVNFGARLQADIPDVASGATVSLINIGAARTVSTALTDAQGNFILNFANGYVADPTATYYLEAVKGLGAHAPGKDALRVRTIIRYADGWTSMTNATPNAGIVVNPSTTALAVAAGLRNGKPDPVDFGGFIGSLSGASQNVYAPVTGISTGDYTAVLALVNDSLAADRDPVASIGLDLEMGWQALGQTLGQTLSVARVASPESKSGPAGTSVTLEGAGFDPTPSSNMVAFNGVEAPVSAVTATQLTTTVPQGATSGQLTVQVAQLVALGPTFTVPVEVTGVSPASGRAGSTVTVTGSGFSAKLWENAVTFAGIPGTVTRATPTELTVTVPATQTGALAVTVSGQSATGGTFTYESPMLAAISPTVAQTGQLLTLEGNFGLPAVVNFPGGVSVPASGTANRLTVTVPEGATAGDLTVTTDGITTRALSFRRSALALGLGALTRWHQQASGARSMPTLGVARSGHTVVVHGDFLYVIGGRGAAGTLSSVEVARIHADGTLGPLKDTGKTLRTPRANHASVVIGNALYVIGGLNGTALATLERATLAADGTLGDFQDAGSLTVAREDHSVAVAGNRLHVIGGRNTTPLASIESAIIAEDGSLGAFQDAGVALSSARAGHSSHVVRDHVYVVAGTNGSTLNTVERARIHADGRLGTFSVLPTTLRTARHNHLSLVLGETLFVTGGTGIRDIVTERSAIASDGSLGAFQLHSDTSLPQKLDEAAGAIVGQTLYVLGGVDGGTYQNGVMRASIDVNPTHRTVEFRPLSFTPFPVKRPGRTSMVVGDHLYILGGFDYAKRLMSTALRARIHKDGSLGPLEDADTMQASWSEYPAVSLLGDRIYPDLQQYLPILPTGMLGTPVSSGITGVTARTSPTSIALGGFLYVIGGHNSETDADRVSVAQDGALSGLSKVNLQLTPRFGHVSAALGNYLYIVGGALVGSDVVQRVAIDPRTAGLTGYAQALQSNVDMMGNPVYLNNGSVNAASAVIGDALYLFGGTGDDTSERLFVGTEPMDSRFERVNFAFSVPSSGRRVCHPVGNVLHFVGDHGIESVRIR